MLHKPLSSSNSSPFRILVHFAGVVAALNLLTSMVCHLSVLARRHSTLAKSRELQNIPEPGGSNWDQVGPGNCKLLHCKVSKSQFAAFQSRQSSIPIFHEPQGVGRFHENPNPICYYQIKARLCLRGSTPRKPIISPCHGVPIYVV